MEPFSLNKMFSTGAAVAPDKAIGHLAFNEKGDLGLILGFELLMRSVPGRGATGSTVFYGNTLATGDLWLSIAPVVCVIKPDPKVATQVFDRLCHNTATAVAKASGKSMPMTLETMLKFFMDSSAGANTNIAKGFTISKEAEEAHEHRRQGGEDEDEDDAPDGTYKG